MRTVWEYDLCAICVATSLHVKDFQAGKRGKCPNCNGSFRIPDKDASYSVELDNESEIPAVAGKRQAFKQTSKSMDTKTPLKSTDSISMLDLNPNESEPNSIESESDVEPSPRSEFALSMPLVLVNAGDVKWFVRPPSGGQFGPAPSRLLMNWISESRVTADSFLWRQGFAQWRLASELLPELFEKTSQPVDFLQTPTDTSATSPELGLNATSTSRTSAVLKKRKQKRRQQLTMVILLATVSIILLGVLILVLVFQKAIKTPSPEKLVLSCTWDQSCPTLFSIHGENCM